jgi:hypothetical protein
MRHLLRRIFTLTPIGVLLMLSACGTNSTPVNFSLSASPSSLALTAGGTGQITVTANSASPLASPVAVTLSGLPAGVTASASTLSLTTGKPQIVTLSAADTATASSSTLAVTGTSGGAKASASAAVTVSAAPPLDFTLSVSPVSLSLTAGGAGDSVQITSEALNGFSGNVAVSLSGLPAGVTASPNTLTLIPGAAQSISLSATAAALAAGGTITFTGTSGSLTHTASLALKVAAAPPAPDCALSSEPASLALTAGAAGSKVTVSVAAFNNFNGSVSVALSGLPAGVSASPAALSSAPMGQPQSVTLSASASAAAAASAVSFTATSGSLVHSATLALTVSAPTGPDITTYHYDNTRQGWNAQETILTLSNVNSADFGLLHTYHVDGKVDGQPLYIGGLALGNGKAENVLYVVTEHDSVYAVNAATGVQLWKTTVLGSGETTSDARGCNQVVPEIGITSTPVIDRGYGQHGALFVVGMTKDANNGYHQRLHALDLLTGAELASVPTEITASYPGTGENSKNGRVVFDPAQYEERASLLLLNGTIYTSWTSHCDIQPYTGWVIGYSEKTLQQSTVLNLTPNGSEGAVWMSGDGLAADSAGNIYLLDANGSLDTGFTLDGFPGQGDYGNAIVKLSTTKGLAVSDYFEPYNTVSESNADVDLGSGGAMLLPDENDSAGAVRHLLIGAGKDHDIYVADRDNMGKFNQSSSDNSNIYQELPNALPNGAWSGPAYFNNTVYYAGVNDSLKAFAISNAKLSTAPTSESQNTFPYPGATPSVSSNGTKDGIVWALTSATSSPAILHAYDAGDLGDELYNSTQASNGRDSFGDGNKFLTPVVANGMVFVGTPNSVAVFGLLHP